jgi:hypothetical protein
LRIEEQTLQIKALKEELESKHAQISTLTNETATLIREQTRIREESERVATALRQERDLAQEQLKNFLNQISSEKSEL